MPFHTDPDLQLDTIRANLDNCPQTVEPEKAELHAVLDASLAAAAHRAREMSDVRGAQRALYDKASADHLYFKGAPRATDDLVWHTRREDKMIRVVELALQASDQTMSAAEIKDAADALVADLAHPTRSTSAIARADDLPIHRHGYPLWVALPGGEAPPIDAYIDYLPARLGLVPEDVVPSRYLLVLLKLTGGFQPRFADSEGYAYWRPGGITEPIEECPDDCSGLTELVADHVNVGNIAKPLQTYLRMF